MRDTAIYKSSANALNPRLAKIFLTTVKTNLSNKVYPHSQIKLGVSAIKQELFVSLNLIVESIEN